jgi:Tfp pilus assembly protein PilF
MKKFLFILFSIAACAPAARAQEAAAGAIWQVLRYDITANLPTIDRNLTARASLSLKNIGRGAGATTTFRINQKADIIAAKINNADAGFRKTTDERLGEFQRFTVTLPVSVQPKGEIVVTIEYRLPVTENSGLAAISAVSSQFLPLSLWYPTPNNPYAPKGGDFAPFRLTVTNSNNAETLVSSGKISNSTIEQNLYAQPFFVTGNWDLIESGNVAVFLPKGAGAGERRRAEELISLANAARSYAAGLFGSQDFPIRLVAVRRGAGFADGGTILLDYAAFRRQKMDESTAQTVVEAIIKVWLANLANTRGEGYGAITEGLTRFVANEFIEKQFGKDAADNERLRQRVSFAAVAKRPDEPPIVQNSPAFATYYASVPNKGAMIWRLVAREMGADKFFAVVRNSIQSGNLTLAVVREALTIQGGDKVKSLLNFGFEQITDTNLMVGLPQQRGAETISALRNTGSLPVTVNVAAVTDKGEKIIVSTTIADKNFGSASFKTAAKIVRVEVDPEKFYPQTEYFDDFVPYTLKDNDAAAAIAALFNQQKFAEAAAAARQILEFQPHYDDVRVWLGRALLEQKRLDDAEREFNTALNEKLPTPRTLGWANVGLGEIALERKQPAEKFFAAALNANADYASTLAARQGRAKSETAPNVDENAKNFFAAFDKAVLTARKSEVDNFVLQGELANFSGRLTANRPDIWQTKVTRTEMIDSNRMVVEANLNAKLLGKEPTSGMAIFVLVKTVNGWKLLEADLREVR